MSAKTRTNPAAAKAAAVRMVGTAEPAPKVTDTPAAISWDDLPPDEVATYVVSTPRVDVEAATPAPIKARVTSAFHFAAAAGEGKGYRVQDCGTEERAEAFVKAARKYAAFKGWTFRGGINPKTPTQVRYVVRVKETRTRTNGDATG